MLLYSSLPSASTADTCKMEEGTAVSSGMEMEYTLCSKMGLWSFSSVMVICTLVAVDRPPWSSAITTN